MMAGKALWLVRRVSPSFCVICSRSQVPFPLSLQGCFWFELKASCLLGKHSTT
jgi:hypothetical protein